MLYRFRVEDGLSEAFTAEEAENTFSTVSRKALEQLRPGETYTDQAGDVWVVDEVVEQVRVEHLPGETVVYVPADRLERIATAVTEVMVNTIRTEDDYQRIRALAEDRGMSVSQWIACDAVKQANALIAELDKQA